MDLHGVIYLVLALAYVEAELHSFAERKIHCGCRECAIAVLYASIAVIILDPSMLPIEMTRLVA
jgi:hypothetical protein